MKAARLRDIFETMNLNDSFGLRILNCTLDHEIYEVQNGSLDSNEKVSVCGNYANLFLCLDNS